MSRNRNNKQNEANKAAQAAPVQTETPATPATPEAAPAIVESVPPVVDGGTLEVMVGGFVIKRALTTIEGEITFDQHGAATIKGTVTSDELGAVIQTKLDKASKAGAQAAYMMRHARKLPPVQVPILDSYGKPTAKTRDEAAFNYVCNVLKANAVTDGAFNNSKQLIEALDFMEDNGISGISVHSVKNAMGKLREWGALPPSDRKFVWSPGKLKLIETAKHCGPLVKALRNGASQSEIELAKIECKQEREAAEKAEREAKEKTAREALGLKEGTDQRTEKTDEAKPDATKPQGDVKPDEAKPDAKPDEATKPQGDEAKPDEVKELAPDTAQAAKHTPESVMRDLVSVQGNWDAAILAGATLTQMRDHCRAIVEKLAIGCGLIEPKA